MMEPEIDYRAVFQALPGAMALLTPQLVYADVNEEFLRTLGRTRGQVIGRYLPDDYAHMPNDPGAAIVRNIQASMHQVAESGEPDTMELQRYDIEDPDRPGVRGERYWSMINVPVFDSDGRMALLMHRLEEVTELIRAREVALSLQEAMLPAPRPVGRHPAAVRYRPAIDALNVCGDWYDLVDLPGDRIAAAVGDVVGHGLPAAQVMGQLRSALSAASRAAGGPARTLEVLGLYARSVDGAENTTAVNTFIDWDTHTITYSSAGHPPPALLQIDGTVEFLDQATDPPLGARPEHGPRPQATVPFTDGAMLALYTDGLIERRREDIGTGLARLADSLTRHQATDSETLADALLSDLLLPGGVTDDTALVIVRL
ncbi:PP2C family protein-serine/threonine phosphatase [Streptantibioticus ferralitis]|uniref:SpoIIE family protein phosphatase n=1 Tax=Streptantibioticus ferralitis TaxID=236510 RepID=A0ABT5ZC26_9ACTN|nr:SpoIIE family protein phosphatase [Streptantibioticus ferralitis]MDF2261400.1 SpoIIE family protein phosphatase [Streptantibioticus ferralitis]